MGDSSATTFSGMISGRQSTWRRTGLGTLTLNGTTAQTYTGPTAVLGGTLALDFSNLGTPTDMIPETSLTLAGGGLSINGNNVARPAKRWPV